VGRGQAQAIVDDRGLDQREARQLALGHEPAGLVDDHPFAVADAPGREARFGDDGGGQVDAAAALDGVQVQRGDEGFAHVIVGRASA
jgi:hypothetical protein